MSKFDAPFGKINVMNKIFLYFETFSYLISSYTIKITIQGQIIIQSSSFVGKVPVFKIFLMAQRKS